MKNTLRFLLTFVEKYVNSYLLEAILLANTGENRPTVNTVKFGKSMTKQQITAQFGKAPLSGKNAIPFLNTLSQAELVELCKASNLSAPATKATKASIIKSIVTALDADKIHFKMEFTIHASTGQWRHYTPLYTKKLRSYITDTEMINAGIDPHSPAPAPESTEA